jgi:potassium-dependent mechanosensitive channel
MSGNFWIRIVLFFMINNCFMPANWVMAQEKADSSTSRFSALKQSIEASLQTNLETIESIKELKTAADGMGREVNAEMNSHKIQESIYSNHLLNPMVQLKTLEEAYLGLTTSFQTIASRLGEVKNKQEEVQKINSQTDELIAITDKQIQDILSEAKSDPEAKLLNKKLKELSKSLVTRKKMLQSVMDTYESLFIGVSDTWQRYDSLIKRFDQMIEKRKKQDLLERKKLIESIGLQKIIADITELVVKAQKTVTREFWTGQFRFVKTSERLFLGSFFLVFLIVMVITFRVRVRLKKLMNHSVVLDKYWTRIVLLLLKRSFILIGATLFFYVMTETERFKPKPVILEVIASFLLVWLFTKWFKDALKLLKTDGQPVFQNNQLFWIRIQIRIIRIFAVFYIVLSWIHTSDSIVIILGRILFAICLYASNIIFWRISDRIKSAIQAGEGDPVPSEFQKCSAVMKSLTYFIIVAGFILDVTGYGSLSQLWFTSWGLSFAVGLLGAMTFKAIREWKPAFKKTQEIQGEETSEAKNSLQWVGVQFLTFLWCGILLVFFVLSWGGKKAVLVGIFEFIKMPLTIGSMKFSLLGLMIAIPILFITQGLARAWRHVFFDNFLEQSGIEEGLKESVTTISIYAIWVVGIILALNALGFDSTSLTLVLGALGIGIGFGLQNIFNNFLSGIILLFERPIQVGDDIEVNGVWATVKKINVRSTIAQTYDNASLIIPNSDLISTQVTNWSFKDRRLRRNIDVGVAYGSDLELVRKTLLEIAGKTSRVLKLPKPDVIFRDFGDSALVFRLRIWTHIDSFMEVETDIRYGIDRLFKERGIEIAFPQMDIHIKRSGNPEGHEVEPDTPSEK